MRDEHIFELLDTLRVTRKSPYADFHEAQRDGNTEQAQQLYAAHQAMMALLQYGADILPHLLAVVDEDIPNLDFVIGRIGKPALPAMLEALRDGDPVVRRTAAAALGYMVKQTRPYSGTPEEHAALNVHMRPVVLPLTQAMRDADAMVRQAAAQALGMIRDAKAVPALVRGLKDPDMGVRDAAGSALSMIRTEEAIDLLIEQLYMNDDDALRQTICDMLASGCFFEALPQLRALKDSAEPPLQRHVIRAMLWIEKNCFPPDKL